MKDSTITGKTQDESRVYKDVEYIIDIGKYCRAQLWLAATELLPVKTVSTNSEKLRATCLERNHNYPKKHIIKQT